MQEQLDFYKQRSSFKSSNGHLRGDVTPEKLGTLLTEVNQQLHSRNNSAVKDDFLSDIIDM